MAGLRERAVLHGTSSHIALRPVDGLLHAAVPHRLSGRRRRRGLAQLLEALRYASDLERGLWDFAVELKCLEAAGLTRSDLRWMVCLGYVEHAHEIAPAEHDSRCFRRGPRLRFGVRSCFVLTPAGVEFVRAALRYPKLAPHRGACGRTEHNESSVAAPPVRPHWDRDRQELRLGNVLVKQFKVPAVNQEKILAAFEEENWPVRIDDPLPPQPDQDPKRRLHDTINSLNRNQRQPLIRFCGDGSGQGVCWEYSAAGADGRRMPRPPR